MSQNGDKLGTFWEHLDELRGVLGRVVIGVVVAGIAAFFFKDTLFSIILAPKESSFITYIWLQDITNLLLEKFQVADSVADMVMIESFDINLINTELTQQFMIHIKMAMYAGLLLILPYILYELFRFVSPALYDKERRYGFFIVGGGYIMFMLGVMLSYFLIFPLTIRFLGTYQVSNEVENLISLNSYIGTLMMLNMMMGIVFEIPILCWLFAKMGFITSQFMRKYRRHAIVLLLFISALITPTTDIMTLILVAMPMYLLYEISILVVQCSKK